MKSRTKLFYWLQRYAWTLLLLGVLGGAWLIGRRQAEEQVATGTKASLPQNAAVKAKLPVKSEQVGPIYRYSVVEGGVHSSEEMQQAIASDAVVAAHYKDLDPAQMQPVRLQHALRVFVSYRKDDMVYWTQHRVTIPAGELLLSDGKNWVRARCGNRLSDKPQAPVSGDEPPETALDEVLTPGKSNISEKGTSSVPVANLLFPSLLFPSSGLPVIMAEVKQPELPFQSTSSLIPLTTTASTNAVPSYPPMGLPGGTPDSPTPVIPSAPVAPSPLTLTFLPAPAPLLPPIATVFGVWQPASLDQEQLFLGEPPIETLPEEIPIAPAGLTAEGELNPPYVPPSLAPITSESLGTQVLVVANGIETIPGGGTEPGSSTLLGGEQTRTFTPEVPSAGILPTNPENPGSPSPDEKPLPKPIESTLAEVPEPGTFLLACAGFGVAFGRSIWKQVGLLYKNK